jgi:GNAT superfamily N-acetyltransferase
MRAGSPARPSSSPAVTSESRSIADDSDRELDAVGIAHCFRDGRGSSSGEVAFAVVDVWQRLGIGTALIQQLAWHCWDCGINSWRATFLWANLAPLKLLARVADGLLTPEIVAGTLTIQFRPRQPDFKIAFRTIPQFQFS